MTSVVDASAVLAVVLAEARGDAMLPHMHKAFMSSVNLAEAVSKLTERGATPEIAWSQLQRLKLNFVDLDIELARSAGEMRVATKPFGLSLGDRACLALGRVKGLPVITTDRDMARVEVGVEVKVFQTER